MCSFWNATVFLSLLKPFHTPFPYSIIRELRSKKPQGALSPPYYLPIQSLKLFFNPQEADSAVSLPRDHMSPKPPSQKNVLKSIQKTVLFSQLPAKCFCNSNFHLSSTYLSQTHCWTSPCLISFNSASSPTRQTLSHLPGCQSSKVGGQASQHSPSSVSSASPATLTCPVSSPPLRQEST